METNIEYQRLRDLIIDIINDSNHYSRLKKRLVNTVIEQFERGVSTITIHVGISEKGRTILHILDRHTAEEQQYFLKKMIAEECELDLLEHTIEVMQ